MILPALVELDSTEQFVASVYQFLSKRPSAFVSNDVTSRFP